MTSPQAATASQIIKDQLSQWGLTELYSDVDRLIKDGLGQEAVAVQLQQTDSYKRRFAANEERTKRGLAVLSPAEYLSVEASYRQVMQSYGLPSGFWDSPEDYTRLISADIAPDEVNERVKQARDVFLSADEGTREMFRDFYGLTDGAGIAAMLDPERAMPVLNRMTATAKAGAAAQRNGLQADQGRLERYADSGYSTDQLTTAFGQIGATRSAEDAMAQRFGGNFSQADSEAARIEGSAPARKQQQELYRSEQALFESRAGADKGSLMRRNTGSY